MIDVLGLIGDDDLGLESSLLLTYEFDPVLYDGLVRRKLASAGATNQVVFCDLRAYEQGLSALFTARFYGKRYSVTPVHNTGAFHPKVYLLLGRRRGRLVVGSGNVTIGGLMRNAEVFGRFDFDLESGQGPHPAFQEAIRLFRDLAESASGVVRRQLKNAVAWAPWLQGPPADDGRRLLVGGAGRVPLLAQIREVLAERRVEAITILSSSFDRQLEGMRRLATVAAGGSVTCIIQPDVVDIDGAAVRRLGSLVEWRPFVDPYKKEKKNRRDVRAHAKILVFNCGDQELVVFGSANASRPALLDENGNTEVVVAFWHNASPSVLDLLGLDSSLSEASVFDQLAAKQWPKSDDETQAHHQCLLIGAVAHSHQVIATIAGTGIPTGAQLQIAEGVDRPALATPALVHAGELDWRAELLVPDRALVARIVGSNGTPASNWCGLTRSDLGLERGSSGLGQRVEAAINAMQDGVVLGTILFELLNRSPHLELAMASRGGGKKSKASGEEADEGSATRSTESFYTDAASNESLMSQIMGDRSDLDILAALIQPLNLARKDWGSRHAEDSDDEDDSAIAEEQERRAIDEKNGRGIGDERTNAPGLASKEVMERAARRLANRLERAAEALEMDLDSIKPGTEPKVVIPAVSVIRQVWMAHIAAFLADRPVTTAEGDEVTCLSPNVFARYVLRVSRVFSGGKAGGLLSALPNDAWTGPDAATLRQGVAFLWTCCLWAADRLEDGNPREWRGKYDDRSAWELAAGFAPDLIPARLAIAVRPHCEKPDFADLGRRLPVCESPALLRKRLQRTEKLASLIADVEAGVKELGNREPGEPGSLAFHPAVGVTVLLGRTESGLDLLDLSLTKRRIRPFVANVVGVSKGQ